ncbi:hypothetical protein [Massilia haematophila]|uniref:Tail assembly chaperone n=1 Tax=Massilia haematophila TaxID=457923 RepID=A0ABV7PDG0_9BURK
MDTTNNSENKQRRAEDRKPNETINWEAPGAPAVPVDAGRTKPANAGAAVAVFEGYDGDTLAPVFKLLGKVQPGEKLYLAGADDAATSGDAPTHARDMLIAEAVRNECLSAAHEADPKHEIRRIDLKSVVARIERAAAPAPTERRGCTSCEWEGETDRMCGSVGPLCPACGDTTEALAASPATASGDELPDNLDYLLEYIPSGAARQEAKRKIEEWVRAAVSVATKPTADLSGLEVFKNADDQSYMVRLSDVQSLLATKPAAQAFLAAELPAAEPVYRLSDIATKPAAAPAVPEGWKLVPVEPTEAMVHAAEDLPAPRMFGKVYRAMLAAAPAASTIGAAQTAEQEKSGGAK